MNLARARSGGFVEYVSLPTVLLVVIACAVAAVVEVVLVAGWSDGAPAPEATHASDQVRLERAVPTHALCEAESDGKVLVAWKNGRHYCFRYGSGELVSAAPSG